MENGHGMRLRSDDEEGIEDDASLTEPDEQPPRKESPMVMPCTSTTDALGLRPVYTAPNTLDSSDEVDCSEDGEEADGTDDGNEGDCADDGIEVDCTDDGNEVDCTDDGNEEDCIDEGNEGDVDDSSDDQSQLRDLTVTYRSPETNEEIPTATLKVKREDPVDKFLPFVAAMLRSMGNELRLKLIEDISQLLINAKTEEIQKYPRPRLQ